MIRDRVNGQPGPVLGRAPVGPGLNRWVRITVAVEPPVILYAALHADSGEIGKLEFPAPDAAVCTDATPVMALFRAREASRFLSEPPAISPR